MDEDVVQFPERGAAGTTYFGVKISSRHDRQHEIRGMKRIVDFLPQTVREEMVSIWCDSNAEAVYDIEVRTNAKRLNEVGQLIEKAIVDALGGLNGGRVISISSGTEFWLDAFWSGDEKMIAEMEAGMKDEGNVGYCVCCGSAAKFTVLLAGADGLPERYPRYHLPNQNARADDTGLAHLQEVPFCHPCIRAIEDNLRATILSLQIKADRVRVEPVTEDQHG
jgi:hypothetical protein